MKITNELKELKIRKSLPQIIIPNNKIEMFINWWNEDIRFQDDIPHSFEEGYVYIDNNIIKYNGMNVTKLISNLAKELHTTYRVIEQRWNEFMGMSRNVTIYFKFRDRHCDLLLYDIQGKLWTNMEFDYGPDGKLATFSEAPINLNETFNMNLQNYQDYFNVICIALFVTSMWYIATTSKNTKYIYNRSNTTDIEDREVKKVKKYKVIDTPIYDFNKIKVIHVDKLVQRRKGWTYSHSFQVHGHYRHYKNGKVIFVNSYVKGKDKDLQTQTYALKPISL